MIYIINDAKLGFLYYLAKKIPPRCMKWWDYCILLFSDFGVKISLPEHFLLVL